MQTVLNIEQLAIPQMRSVHDLIPRESNTPLPPSNSILHSSPFFQTTHLPSPVLTQEQLNFQLNAEYWTYMAHFTQENEEPLRWWKENHAKYPDLWLLACKYDLFYCCTTCTNYFNRYLCIPASSVPSESAFSKMGWI